MGQYAASIEEERRKIALLKASLLKAETRLSSLLTLDSEDSDPLDEFLRQGLRQDVNVLTLAVVPTPTAINLKTPPLKVRLTKAVKTKLHTGRKVTGNDYQVLKFIGENGRPSKAVTDFIKAKGLPWIGIKVINRLMYTYKEMGLFDPHAPHAFYRLNETGLTVLDAIEKGKY